MSKNRMAVRLNLPTLLGALALMSVAGCESDGDRDGDDERAQIDPSIDASVDCVSDDGDAGAVDAGGPVGIDGGLLSPRIVGVTANGSGCPADSFTATVSPDGQSVTVDFTQFQAEVSSESTLSNKFCQLGIDVTAEDGRQYQLSRASVRGTLELEEGVSGVVEVNSYFQGNPTVADLWRTDLNGPNSDELILDTPEATENWSPCGLDRDVNVRFTGRLSNVASPEASGSLRLNQVQVFNLRSQACTQN